MSTELSGHHQIIKTKNTDFRTGTYMKWLEGRLPDPVDDLDQWRLAE